MRIRIVQSGVKSGEVNDPPSCPRGVEHAKRIMFEGKNKIRIEWNKKPVSETVARRVQNSRGMFISRSTYTCHCVWKPDDWQRLLKSYSHMQVDMMGKSSKAQLEWTAIASYI
ncbi:hypothetical protein KQX54_007216 [Cotesia glomerata]|uniref:Uncharacterized protein n=1 Tax=Cotesia glomerata TaxID=32391 RepID=A0AAV7I638_COTGL|nr:hypothetical protein KQX54_007216 [Cotesia glomerata]